MWQRLATGTDVQAWSDVEPVDIGWAHGQREEHLIKADPQAQSRLLKLQVIDSALARLRHQRRTLPEHAELQRLAAEEARLASDLVAADTAVSDLESDQARAEADLEPVRERLARNQRRIADGSVADPKALGSMVEEVDHLRKRIGDLEDAELEVMEELEAAQVRRDRLRVEATTVADRIAEVTRHRDAELARLDAEVAERHAERDELLPLLPQDLLALYTKIGSGHNGVGAAELRSRRCSGCQLEINAADLRAIKASADDDVVRCEECSRILIRTDQSGL